MNEGTEYNPTEEEYDRNEILDEKYNALNMIKESTAETRNEEKIYEASDIGYGPEDPRSYFVDICNQLGSFWQDIAAELDNTININEIYESYDQNYQRTRAVLKRWYQNNSENATFDRLIEALINIDRGDMSDHLDFDRQIMRSIQGKGLEIRTRKRNKLLNRLQDETFSVVDGVGFISERPSRISTQSEKELKSIMNSIQKNDSDTVLDATRRLRKLLYADPYVQDILDLDIIERLIDLLNDDGQQAQLEATSIIAIISSGSSIQTATVLQAGSAPFLIELLSSSNTDIQEQSVWALGNMASESTQCRDYLIELEIMEPLLNLQTFRLIKNNPSLPLLRNAIWALSNLCLSFHRMPDMDEAFTSLPILVKLLSHEDNEVLIDTCTALSNLADGIEIYMPVHYQIGAVVNAGACEPLIKLLRHEDEIVQSTALKVVNNISIGTESQIQTLIDAQVLPSLLHVLDSSDDVIKMQTCRILSNFAAGNNSQAQAVLDANISPKLLMIRDTVDAKTQNEIVLVYANLIEASTKQIKNFVDHKVLKLLCDVLTISNTEVVRASVQALSKMVTTGSKSVEIDKISDEFLSYLEEIGGITKIKALINHKDEKICAASQNILDIQFASSKDNK
ncbi:Importin subunit alpha-7 [Trichoplax sp. H2]|nr:Importin subunit alpha-7 [Trichoplax sp. H2]|eukprot:RDD41061.1 Importin subunit alpha-7 [Trichoplax sp. H2]